jgi:Asp-tRNA(Asn)/Glu-tRNA(Gln) amidotransferase A subunit family amidase
MTLNFETRLAPLAELLRSGRLNLNHYLDRLEAYFENENERILAFLPEEGRFERLRQEAAQLESYYSDPLSRPPLYGVPIGVKDIFHVEGFPTQAGSKLPAEILAGPEAASVTQLKQAGALILGKTVTTEFAYFGPGPTRNPRNVEHTPGGSSSGSAAAVGAGLCPLALGTQTVGSVNRPAAFCGVVGFKPTSGRISTRNVIPLSKTLDHIGFFTQDVAGASLAASVLCQGWQKSKTIVLDSKRLSLGIPAGPYLEKAEAEGLNNLQATHDKLKAAGFEIKVVEAMPNFDEIYQWHMDLVAAEAAAFHAAWFAEFGERYHDKTKMLLEQGRQVSAEQAQQYKARRQQVREELTELMAAHQIEMWLSPAAPGAAPAGLESTGNPVMNLPWTYTGLPSVSLPSGAAANGLPLGVQVVAGWQQDEQLLAWAGYIEAALK